MTDLPDWLQQVSGRRPLLLVAPHGGRRPKLSELKTAAPRKVNDLGTAELTLELAQRSSVSAIVNPLQDRNHVDLNRVSHVRRHAAWLVEILLDAIRTQIAAEGGATVVFIHGWNAVQPSCDIGIGARIEADRLVPVRQGVPTIPRSFLPRLLRFAAECRGGGISVTFGDRYPAAGRDNMLQLFTSRYADDPDPMIRQIAALGAEGKIAAVQLELSVPLRWPGPLREHFLESASRFLRNEIRDLPTAHDTPSSPTHRQNPPQRLALEFHDGTAGVGGFAAFERLDSGRRHARLLFCLGNARLVLFTGEDATADDDGTRCAGVEWKRSEGDGVALHYDGPCLMFGSSDAFLDLEAGLAAAELSRLEVHLDWKPAGAEGPSSWRSRSGHVTGRVDFDGVHTQIASPATVDTADPTELPKGPWRERRRLRVPLGEEVFLSISSRIDEEELAEGEIARGGVLEPILSATVKVHRGFDGRTPVAWRVDAVSRSGPLRIFGQVTRAIPVVRAAANGRALLFFGLARYSADIGVGYGTFEDWQCLVEP